MAIVHSQDEDGAGDTFADLGFEFFDAGYRQAKFDLMLEAWRDEEGLALVLDYDAELFDASTVATLAQRFVVLLGAIVAEPSRPVADLPVLTAADQRFLDRRAHAAADQGPLVPELIARAADRAPDAVAVSCADETLSYAQLRERADAVASRLAGHEVVGVCLERSTDMVVALLAAWSRGRRLPAPRPGVSGRAARIHDRGQRRVHGYHSRNDHRSRGHRRLRTCESRHLSPGRGRARSRARARLRHLHLRLDWRP